MRTAKPCYIVVTRSRDVLYEGEVRLFAWIAWLFARARGRKAEAFNRRSWFKKPAYWLTGGSPGAGFFELGFDPQWFVQIQAGDMAGSWVLDPFNVTVLNAPMKSNRMNLEIFSEADRIIQAGGRVATIDALAEPMATRVPLYVASHACTSTSKSTIACRTTDSA
jgi:hypothetical protein